MTLSTLILDGSEAKKKKLQQTKRNLLRKAIWCAAGVATLTLIPAIASSASPLVLRAVVLDAHAASANDVHLLAALDGTGSGIKETNLGDLAADAVANAGKTQIAFVPADEISATTVQPGSVDPEQIVLALSYYGDATDTVQVLDLTGDQIVKALTRSVSRKPQAFPGYLQIAGLKIKVDKDIVTATLANGTALDLNAHYKVSMSAPLAAGELGYFSVWGDSKPKDTGISIAQAMRGFLADNREIPGTIFNRITEH